jgi:hypothetical protein
MRTTARTRALPTFSAKPESQQPPQVCQSHDWRQEHLGSTTSDDRSPGVPNAEVIRKAIRPEIFRTLADRAWLFSRLARTESEWSGRQVWYGRKVELLCLLITLDAAVVLEYSPRTGLVLLGLPNAKRLHCPVDRLDPVARDLVARRVMTLCAWRRRRC